MSVLVVVCKRMQQLPTMLGPEMYRGKDTSRKTLETNLKNVGRAVQKDPTLVRYATLRRSRNKKNVASCSLKSFDMHLGPVYMEWGTPV